MILDVHNDSYTCSVIGDFILADISKIVPAILGPVAMSVSQIERSLGSLSSAFVIWLGGLLDCS